jgi:hypothetical protein
VTGDDAGDVAGAERSGRGAARQREQQVLGRSHGAALDPGDDRRQGVFVERDGAGAAALAIAHDRPPGGGALNGLSEPRVAGAAALVDVGHEQAGGFGAPQAGGAEQVQ